MDIDRMVLLSLATGRKFVKNENWGDLMDAQEFLLGNVIANWTKENPTVPYDIYSHETTKLINSFLVERFPEIEYFCSLVEEEEDPRLGADCIPKLPKTFTISAIPVDYKIKKQNIK
jgi:hypothetical protein